MRRLLAAVGASGAAIPAAAVAAAAAAVAAAAVAVAAAVAATAAAATIAAAAAALAAAAVATAVATAAAAGRRRRRRRRRAAVAAAAAPVAAAAVTAATAAVSAAVAVAAAAVADCAAAAVVAAATAAARRFQHPFRRVRAVRSVRRPPRRSASHPRSSKALDTSRTRRHREEQGLHCDKICTEIPDHPVLEGRICQGVDRISGQGGPCRMYLGVPGKLPLDGITPAAEYPTSRLVCKKGSMSLNNMIFVMVRKIYENPNCVGAVDSAPWPCVGTDASAAVGHGGNVGGQNCVLFDGTAATEVSCEVLMLVPNACDEAIGILSPRRARRCPRTSTRRRRRRCTAPPPATGARKFASRCRRRRRRRRCRRHRRRRRRHRRRPRSRHRCRRRRRRGRGRPSPTTASRSRTSTRPAPTRKTGATRISAPPPSPFGRFTRRRTSLRPATSRASRTATRPLSR